LYTSVPKTQSTRGKRVDFRDVVQVIRDVVVLHATGAAGPYLSLWTRLPNFPKTCQVLETWQV
jgi:hypothetical protein